MTGLVGNNNGSVHQRLNNVLHVQTKSIYHKSVNHGGPGINTGLIQSIHSIVGDVPTHISGGSSTAAVTGSTTTNYLTVSNDPNRPQTAVVMMASSVMPAKVSTLSSLLTAGSSTAATGSIGSNRKANSSTPSSSSPSPSNENSEEAKNQLLKQLLNTNYQHSSSSDGQDSSRSNLHLMGNKDDPKGIKRPASGSLDNAPSAKSLSVVCSENPNLTELLEKPPHSSITVPPPVPTKWHQEPREKLPKDIMRKFLPPHPAERAAAAAAAAAAATAASTKTTTVSAGNSTAAMITTTNSALYHVLTSRSHNKGGLQPVYSTNSANSGTITTASTSAASSGGNNLMLNDDKDELSEILDGLIEIEPSPMVAAVPNAAPIMASRADERRISDIERFLVSSEHHSGGAQASGLNQQQKQQQQINKPKMSSLAASAPSLTSILSAPPLAATASPTLPPGRPPAPNGARLLTGSSSNTNSGGGGSTSSGGNPVNLVPRMNELLQQIPPNVSIPDTPDLNSLILLQERRRRMSSGGGGNATASGSTSAATATGLLPSSTSPRAPSQVTIVQTQPQPQNRGQLLMQHLTSSRSAATSFSAGSSGQRPSTISYMEQSNNSHYNNGSGTQNNVPPTSVPQVLARRSSFSGTGSTNAPPMISPPPGASAAAAAVVNLAAASRQPPQRHASGGSTIHHVVRGSAAGSGGISGLAGSLANPRRLSDTMETVNSEEKQRSLLQQLLSE